VAKQTAHEGESSQPINYGQRPTHASLFTYTPLFAPMEWKRERGERPAGGSIPTPDLASAPFAICQDQRATLDAPPWKPSLRTAAELILRPLVTVTK